MLTVGLFDGKIALIGYRTGSKRGRHKELGAPCRGQGPLRRTLLLTGPYRIPPHRVSGGVDLLRLFLYDGDYLAKFGGSA